VILLDNLASLLEIGNKYLSPQAKSTTVARKNPRGAFKFLLTSVALDKPFDSRLI
jgi:hypothetical protein